MDGWKDGGRMDGWMMGGMDATSLRGSKQEVPSDLWSERPPTGPGGVVGDGGVSNGGLIYRVGSLTKMPNGSDLEDHYHHDNNKRASFSHHRSRHPSVRNGPLDYSHNRLSYYKHGR